MTAKMMVVEVDGLPVEVDSESYANDREEVEEAVRRMREVMVGDLKDLHEIAPDFDELEASYESE